MHIRGESRHGKTVGLQSAGHVAVHVVDKYVAVLRHIRYDRTDISLEFLQTICKITRVSRPTRQFEATTESWA